MNKYLITLLTALAISGSSHGALAAGTYKVIHNFCTEEKCADGKWSRSTLTADGAGNYYGTTMAGGTKDGGTIFRMSPNGAQWKFTELYKFCSVKGCKDGSSPRGGVTVDTDGNLYGATFSGGAHGQGAVFQLSRNGKLKVLHSFCIDETCSDGAVPQSLTLSYQGMASGVPYDGTSPLFGTASAGAHNGGVVFSLTPNAAKTKWTYKVIHDFCANDPCTDGGHPFSGVSVDASGNLFGALTDGGAYAHGAIFEMQKNGSGWKYILVHSFCSDQDICADGNAPVAAPVMDGAGNLYGTTLAGGSAANRGSVYKLVPNGSKWTFTSLHAFCAETNCTDGRTPYAGVMVDPNGNLFGTTEAGGDVDNGTLYELSGKQLTTFTRLESFDSKKVPGATPFAAPTQDSSGALFGTAANGSSKDAGVIFKFTP